MHPVASAAITAYSTALRFSTGSDPGMPRQTGQVFAFGGSPNRVGQEQKIFVSVLSWAWTSRPMTGSYAPAGGSFRASPNRYIPVPRPPGIMSARRS